MNTLIQWISCVKVASNFLFRQSVRHVGRTNTQVPWFVWQAKWTVNSLARCVTRNGWCLIQYTMSKCLLKCWFPLLARIAEWRNVPYQNHRNYAWKLQSLPESQNRTIAECLEIKIASAVTQICRFASTKSSWKITSHLNLVKAPQNHCEEKRKKFITPRINNKSPSHYGFDTCRHSVEFWKASKSIFFSFEWMKK